jgi:hypothetical protein
MAFALFRPPIFLETLGKLTPVTNPTTVQDESWQSLTYHPASLQTVLNLSSPG